MRTATSLHLIVTAAGKNFTDQKVSLSTETDGYDGVFLHQMTVQAEIKHPNLYELFVMRCEIMQKLDARPAPCSNRPHPF